MNGKKTRGYNSYVAPEPRYEYQIDLFYYNNPNADEDTPYGLLAIDSFTKYCWIVPLDKKDSIYWIYGLKVIFEKMGKPKVIYSDPDSSLQANLIKQFFEKENIKWIQTREHASIAERAIRTIKNELDKRIEIGRAHV